MLINKYTIEEIAKVFLRPLNPPKEGLFKEFYLINTDFYNYLNGNKNNGFRWNKPMLYKYLSLQENKN
jgi:hypothetical protein